MHLKPGAKRFYILQKDGFSIALNVLKAVFGRLERGKKSVVLSFHFMDP